MGTVEHTQSFLPSLGVGLQEREAKEGLPMDEFEEVKQALEQEAAQRHYEVEEINTVLKQLAFAVPPTAHRLHRLHHPARPGMLARA